VSDVTPGLAEQALDTIDLRALVLPVIEADASEVAAHEVVLKELDKSGGLISVWRNLTP